MVDRWAFSNLEYLINPQPSELGTLEVLAQIYYNRGFPSAYCGDTTWRSRSETVNHNGFVALLGNDAIKGTVWMLNDHSTEIGGEEIIEITTRWTGQYPDTW